MLRVGEAIEALRDRINDEPRTRDRLRKNPARWTQLCAAMDYLGDIDMALVAYLHGHKPAEADFGERYLRLYGVLQALYVQQDAIDHLFEAVGLDRPDPHETLLEIRNVRNLASGHPTKADRRKPTLFSFITRVFLGNEGFMFRSSSGEDFGEMKGVNVRDLIQKQDQILAERVSEAEEHLMTIEKEHRATFEGKRLVDCFPPLLTYGMEKAAEGIRAPRARSIGKLGPEQIRIAIVALDAALAERGIERSTYIGFEEARSRIEYPLEQLTLYLNGESCDIPNASAANVFLDQLRALTYSLRDMAMEIDLEYESPAGDPGGSPSG